MGSPVRQSNLFDFHSHACWTFANSLQADEIDGCYNMYQGSPIPDTCAGWAHYMLAARAESNMAGM
jgi:hypothetical protein